jgi:hypothetical protein
VIVGALSYDNGETDEGAAFVYLGSSSGLTATAAWQAESNQIDANWGTAVASAGDVNGDGFGDILVGAYHYDNGETDEGAAFLYYGNGGDNTGLGLSLTPQTHQPHSSTPISSGLTSTSETSFDLALTARHPSGRAPVALQIKVKPLGALFDGTELITTAFTDSGLTGVAIQETIDTLDLGTGYHWRARVRASPATGSPQGWGHWVYGGLSGQAQSAHVFTAADGDGFGDPLNALLACEPPSGYLSDNTDCDDTTAAISSSSQEVCDPLNLDEDCDGLSDDEDPSATGQSTFYLDGDQDGYGTTLLLLCDPTATTSILPNDCDDQDSAIYPGAPESCTDTEDLNCDGLLPNIDADSDSFKSCEDCDDTNATVYPTAPELCDGLDNDCDGNIDLNAVDASSYFADTDEDGYGDPEAEQLACTQPDGFVEDATDCDDSAAEVHPGASEDCSASFDLNCDGSWGLNDQDGDGFFACEECDDSNATIHPDAAEICDGLDNDCDTLIDDEDGNITGQSVFYLDTDEDGYGNANTSVLACEAPEGFVVTPGDCEEGNAEVHPGALEICDGIDNDCNPETQEDGCDSSVPQESSESPPKDSSETYAPFLCSCSSVPPLWLGAVFTGFLALRRRAGKDQASN